MIDNKYSKIINSIKLKSRILYISYLLLVVISLFVMPSIVYFIIFFLFLFCGYLLLYVKIRQPIDNALNKECDPIKYKELFFSDVNKRPNKTSILSANFNISFLTGDFESAIAYANDMISQFNFNSVVAGLSNRAIAEFFSKDYNALKDTVAKFHDKVATASHLKRNEMEIYINNSKRLDLYVAIAQKDTDKAVILSNDIKIFNKTTLVEVQINFLKGATAALINDTDKAKEHFDFVKQYGSKTVFASSINEYINE